jgi:peptidoglycan/xylan/chitin deacetylase (PgdA/CDA1 family)
MCRFMLMRRQDIGVLLLHCLGYSRARNLLLRIRRKPVARFVTFHDILPEALEGFNAKVRYLKRRTNVVSLSDFFEGRLSADRINVVITFDDGYKSWVRAAVPVLRELELPATFFVSSGFVGLSEGEHADFTRSKLFALPDAGCRTTGGLSIEDVMKIVEGGFTIGGHTVNHCRLSDCIDRSRLRYEITEDKARLEEITGRPINYFAYPSGEHRHPELNLSEELRDAGYKGAVTTMPGFNSAETDRYLLHRDLTDAPMPAAVFRARVFGNYDAVRILKQGAMKLFGS